MLRATSEIAVAISVSSLLERRSGVAMARAFCRANRMSTSARIGTTVSMSLATNGEHSILPRAKEGETVFQVECRRGSFQPQAELHHREGNVRLDADDDGVRSQYPHHLGNAAQRADGEGIHDVQHRHIDDDAGGPM